MTKEAKLTAAMRILPEWKGYDEEIRKLQQKIDSGVLDPESTEVPETLGKSLFYYQFLIIFLSYFIQINNLLLFLFQTQTMYILNYDMAVF